MEQKDLYKAVIQDCYDYQALGTADVETLKLFFEKRNMLTIPTATSLYVLYLEVKTTFVVLFTCSQRFAREI